METETQIYERIPALDEAVESTNNQWRKVSVGDLNKCLRAMFGTTPELSFNHIIRCQASDTQKELETIHLVQLLRLFRVSELLPFSEKLKEENPSDQNDIQPLWEPDYNNNQVVLEVTLNDCSKLVLFDNGEYLKIPLEI